MQCHRNSVISFSREHSILENDNEVEFYETCDAHKVIGEPKNVPLKLWHYTSSEGLKGIVESNYLRFAEAIYMNDATETRYGMGVFETVFNTFNSNANFQYLSEIRTSAFEFINSDRPIICCLCEEENLLNQWRAYGKSETAYCIGFDAGKLRDSDWNFQPHLFPIIYDRATQINFMTKLLDEVVKPPFGSLGLSAACPQQISKIKYHSIQQILDLIFRFKDPCFAAEREWRLLAKMSDVRGQYHNLKEIKQEESAKLGKPIEYPDMQIYGFNSTPLGILPFYGWKPNTSIGKLPITDVYVGPGNNADISELALKYFLDFNDLKNVKTHVSTIPLRK
jgi:Protein of unknown function (DUF2971)